MDKYAQLHIREYKDIKNTQIYTNMDSFTQTWINIFKSMDKDTLTYINMNKFT